MSERVALQPVDAVEVPVLADNTIDILLPSTEQVQRAPVGTPRTSWRAGCRPPLRRPASGSGCILPDDRLDHERSSGRPAVRGR